MWKDLWILCLSAAVVAALPISVRGEADPYDAKAIAADPAIHRAVILYTQDNAPATPKLEDLPLQESVSQYGITWTFEKPARVGQFVNGDWYVVGPVTVKAIDPTPLYGSEIPQDATGPHGQGASRRPSASATASCSIRRPR